MELMMTETMEEQRAKGGMLENETEEMEGVLSSSHRTLESHAGAHDFTCASAS